MLEYGYYEESYNNRSAPHGRSYVVYTFTYVYGYMDVDVDKMDIIPLEVSYKDELRVYFIQIICWSILWA